MSICMCVCVCIIYYILYIHTDNNNIKDCFKTCSICVLKINKASKILNNQFSILVHKASTFIILHMTSCRPDIALLISSIFISQLWQFMLIYYKHSTHWYYTLSTLYHVIVGLVQCNWICIVVTEYSIQSCNTEGIKSNTSITPPFTIVKWQNSLWHTPTICVCHYEHIIYTHYSGVEVFYYLWSYSLNIILHVTFCTITSCLLTLIYWLRQLTELSEGRLTHTAALLGISCETHLHLHNCTWCHHVNVMWKLYCTCFIVAHS